MLGNLLTNIYAYIESCFFEFFSWFYFVQFIDYADDPSVVFFYNGGFFDCSIEATFMIYFDVSEFIYAESFSFPS